jgi:hypothetical protein
MTRFFLVSAAALALTACTGAQGGFHTGSIEPIPGSITYKGQPRTKLTKSPVGSTFVHKFMDGPGRFVEETYRIEPDRSLAIVDRQIIIDFER